MNKMEKLKKGLIKITYFDKNCKCKEPITTTKKVDNKVFTTCTTCNCVMKNSIEEVYGVAV